MQIKNRLLSAATIIDVTGSVSWTYNFPQKSYDTAVQVTVNADGITQTVVTPVAKGS